MIKHFNITLKGKVQGVAFRKTAQEEALRLGVSGFIRNEPKGDVYLEAEGHPDKLSVFVEWCSHGPQPAARVDKLHIVEAEPVNFEGFKIVS